MGILLLGILKNVLIVSAAILVAFVVSAVWGTEKGYRWRKTLWLVLALWLLVPVWFLAEEVHVKLPGRGLQITVWDPAHLAEKLTGQQDTSMTFEVRGTAGTDSVNDTAGLSEPGRVNDTAGAAEPGRVNDAAGTAGTGRVNDTAGTVATGRVNDTAGAAADTIHDTVKEAYPDTVYDTSGTKGQKPGGSFLGNLLLLSIWIAIAAILFRFRYLQYQQMKRKLMQDAVEDENPAIQKKVSGISDEYGIRRKIPVFVSSAVHSPMLFGYFFPVILLPQAEYDDAELSLILHHELTHYKSRDLWYKLLLLVVCDLYWFAPVLRMMKYMAYQDVEYVCDDRVVKSLEKDETKLYGNIILKTMKCELMSGESDKEYRTVTYGTQFVYNKKSAEKRFQNIFVKKKSRSGYIVLGVLVLLVAAVTFHVVIVPDSAIYAQEMEEKNGGEWEEGRADAGSGEDGGEVTNDAKANDHEDSGRESLPFFEVDSIENLHLGDPFELSDYYITNRCSSGNRFYIDEEGNLWGYGGNEYGQMGNGTAQLEAFYEEPVKIAENVISVDKSINNYFVIFLTADGKLYGMGTNRNGIFGRSGQVTGQMLLMEDVAYARAGMENIVVLKKDGSVWWWGRYQSTYATEVGSMDGMYSETPMKLLDNCIYVSTGNWTGAGITADGELYTWGLNLFGECGVEVTQDYVREPVKVLDGVRMVWPEKIFFNDIQKDIPDINRIDHQYNFNLFVEMQDGSIMACGLDQGNYDLADQKKTIEITGDLYQPSTHYYTASFVPVELREYSEERNRKVLEQCVFGMERQKIERILKEEKLAYFQVDSFSERGRNDLYMCVDDSRYYLFFDSAGSLDRIVLQEGGSRNGLFTMGMSLEEVQQITGDILVEIEEEDMGTDVVRYGCKEPLDGIYYEFNFYRNELNIVTEYGETGERQARFLSEE